MSKILKVTENAIEYIQNTRPTSKHALKISIEKGGCAGSKYVFEYISFSKNELEGKNEIIDVESKCCIVIPKIHVLKLFNSTLDFKTSQFSSELVFVNPNESTSCGCGESISF